MKTNSLHGARQYYSILGRWDRIDPLSEKYYSISPYSYCGNNPIRFVDPYGLFFTESSWKYLNTLLNDIDKREKENANKIAMFQERIHGGDLSEKKVLRLQRKIDKIKANTAELENVRNEISILSASTQAYDVAFDDSRNISYVSETQVFSSAYFNTDNDVFEIRLGDNSLGLMAHELKHAYQFETGKYSTGLLDNGAPFYDQSDEWEAYRRGELFGGPRLFALPEIYSQYQVGPVDFTFLNPMILNDLQKYAVITKSAFRINGVTYNGIPKK